MIIFLKGTVHTQYRIFAFRILSRESFLRLLHEPIQSKKKSIRHMSQ